MLDLILLPKVGLKELLSIIFLRLFLNLLDKIIVNSYEFKKRFKNKFNLETTCIYNPLDKDEIIKKSKISSTIKFNKQKLNIINGELINLKKIK